jgi:hypothetical protein
MSVFYPLPSKEQIVAQHIDAELAKAAVAMLRAYYNIRNLVYDNAKFKDEKGVIDSNAIYSAFEKYTLSGLSAEQLGQSARIIKASLNQFAPATIVDDVSEAKISY